MRRSDALKFSEDLGGHAADPGLFGESFERHLASLAAPICGIEPQTPQFVDYFRPGEGRLFGFHRGPLA